MTGSPAMPDRTAAYDPLMSGPCCTPPPQEYRRLFSRKMARKDVRRFRRRGLSRSARGLVDAAGSVAGATVLDVGGGVGQLGIALLERGAAHATTVELSAGYEDAAAALVAERGLSGRVDRRIGDLVMDAGLTEPHDVVVLHRVVCCYPNADALVAAASRHARRTLLLTYPRVRGLNRLGFGAINVWLRLTRCGFRTFVHPFAAIAAAAEREGLALTARERQGFVWENAVFERSGER
jgi:magnesium-protoporphyrin O-methyltransferase